MFEIVITLTFASVMLLFMTFPATKIVNFLEKYIKIDEKLRNILLVIFTILLSLLVAVFLRYG